VYDVVLVGLQTGRVSDKGIPQTGIYFLPCSRLPSVVRVVWEPEDGVEQRKDSAVESLFHTNRRLVAVSPPAAAR
jgi:hypothetical protein